MWRSVLGAEFLRRPRLSRIYYRGKFFDYPLKPMNALFNLGLFNSLSVLLSYLRCDLVFPIAPEVSFEDWVSNRFGRRLFLIFFKTYTEKVWGIPCNEIGAEWAAQRIKGLSLWTAVIEHAASAARTSAAGDDQDADRRVRVSAARARHDVGDVRGATSSSWADASQLEHRASRHASTTTGASRPSRSTRGRRSDASPATTSSRPCRCASWCRRSIRPRRPRCSAAAERLKYRDFLTVALIVDGADLFPDNWIYIHDARVKVGRIQNFKNWSPDMVPDPGRPASGWSTSASRATACGRCPTPI